MTISGFNPEVLMTPIELRDLLRSDEIRQETSRCVLGIYATAFHEEGRTLETRELVEWTVARILEEVRRCHHWTAFLLLEWMCSGATIDRLTARARGLRICALPKLVNFVTAAIALQFGTFLAGEVETDILELD